MSPPSYREERISQIPAQQTLIGMGYRYLTPAEADELRGGSGHAFKFGPALERFAWRSVAAVTRPTADSTRMLEES